VGLVLGKLEEVRQDRNDQDAAADPEQAARNSGDEPRPEGRQPIAGRARGGYPELVVFLTSRTTSAKRVALVGAPSTTAIMSRPPVRNQVARQ